MFAFRNYTISFGSASKTTKKIPFKSFRFTFVFISFHFFIVNFRLLVPFFSVTHPQTQKKSRNKINVTHQCVISWLFNSFLHVWIRLSENNIMFISFCLVVRFIHLQWYAHRPVAQKKKHVSNNDSGVIRWEYMNKNQNEYYDCYWRRQIHLDTFMWSKRLSEIRLAIYRSLLSLCNKNSLSKRWNKRNRKHKKNSSKRKFSKEFNENCECVCVRVYQWNDLISASNYSPNSICFCSFIHWTTNI